MDVLLRVYAKCIHGQQDEAKRRILEATQAAEVDNDPADSEDNAAGDGSAPSM